MKKDELYMRKALQEAEYAFSEDEVPVGAVIVYKDKIIAKAHNQVEMYRACSMTLYPVRIQIERCWL